MFDRYHLVEELQPRHCDRNGGPRPSRCTRLCSCPLWIEACGSRLDTERAISSNFCSPSRNLGTRTRNLAGCDETFRYIELIVELSIEGHREAEPPCRRVGESGFYTFTAQLMNTVQGRHSTGSEVISIRSCAESGMAMAPKTSGGQRELLHDSHYGLPLRRTSKLILNPGWIGHELSGGAEYTRMSPSAKFYGTIPGLPRGHLCAAYCAGNIATWLEYRHEFASGPRLTLGPGRRGISRRPFSRA